ncbi:hypothetical protein Tco_0008422 [Tanacetum coccineum]
MFSWGENDAMSLNVLVDVIMCLYVMWYAPWLCVQLELFMWYAPWLCVQLELFMWYAPWLCVQLEAFMCYAFSDSLLLTPLCCDDIHDVTPRVSALAGCDRLVSEPLVIEKEAPSFDGLKPQPLLNSPSLDVSLRDVIGPEPPIKPHSPDSSRMKGLESKKVSPLGEELSLFDRPNKVEKGRILEAHRLEPIFQQQISQRMAHSHHDEAWKFLGSFIGQFLDDDLNQLSHVSSPLLSKPGEY